MYAPPPVLASNYDSENEQHALNISNKYRKTRSIAGDSLSYTKINGKANLCDGGVVNRLLSFRDTSTKKKKIQLQRCILSTYVECVYKQWNLPKTCLV